MYNDKTMEHFKNPHNQGRIEDATVVGDGGNPICGDMLKLYLKIKPGPKGDIIEDVKFETLGCVAAIAASSMVTDLVKGKTIDEALKVKGQNVAEALGGLPPIKMHCSLVCVEALEDAIKKYKEEKNK